jgi:hypothetical protein
MDEDESIVQAACPQLLEAGRHPFGLVERVPHGEQVAGVGTELQPVVAHRVE